MFKCPSVMVGFKQTVFYFCKEVRVQLLYQGPGYRRRRRRIQDQKLLPVAAMYTKRKQEEFSEH